MFENTKQQRMGLNAFKFITVYSVASYLIEKGCPILMFIGTGNVLADAAAH